MPDVSRITSVPTAGAVGAKGPAPTPGLRFFFFSDTHAGFVLTDKFVREANRQKPDLVVDGGDIVEEGTQPEFDQAYADRARLQSPLAMVTGNHDVLRRGPFTSEPPRIAEFQSFDRKGVHFILLDNENEEISDALFKKLEADLEANKGKTTIVAMHVPPVLTREAGFVKLRKIVPFGSASPRMKIPEQVDRFKALMKKYEVSAVLAGHTHAPSETTIEWGPGERPSSGSERGGPGETTTRGTKYAVAGAVGGKTPGPGIAHEYLDINVVGRDVQIRRVPLDKPPTNLVSHAFYVGNYIAKKNAHNHAVLGWDNYVPSTSAETRLGMRHTETKHGSSDAVTLTGEIETMLNDQRGKGAWFAEGTAAIGSNEASADLGLGYKRRLLGDFNRNVYVSGSAVVNGGVIADRLTAGVGARAAIGAERKNWTFQLSHERATNRDATMFSVGYRF